MPALVPQKHGGALRAGGTPGNRGGKLGGRPPNDVLAWSLRQVNNPRTKKRMRHILREAQAETFLKAYALLSNRALGMPTNRVIEAKLTLAELLADVEPDADV